MRFQEAITALENNQMIRRSNEDEDSNANSSAWLKLNYRNGKPFLYAWQADPATGEVSESPAILDWDDIRGCSWEAKDEVTRLVN